MAVDYPTSEFAIRRYEYLGEQRVTTIDIGSWSSTCCNCGLPATPGDGSHKVILGYGGPHKGKPGCGTEWRYFDTGYGASAVESVRRQWPHLKPAGFAALCGAGEDDGQQDDGDDDDQAPQQVDGPVGKGTPSHG